jgi:hypothetical protein
MFCVFPCVFAAFYFFQQFYQIVINGRLLSTYSSSFLFYIFCVLLNQGIVCIIKLRSVFGNNILDIFFRFQGSYCPEKKLFIRLNCVRLVFGGFRFSHQLQQSFDFLRHHSQLRATNSLRSRFVQCLKDSRRGERRSGL